MICIEDRGGKPEQAGPIQPHRRADPVPAGPFALGFRLGSSFPRVDRVCGVGGRLDVAIAQVAATYADLKRNVRFGYKVSVRNCLGVIPGEIQRNEIRV